MRPFSLLSCVAKMAERLVLSRLAWRLVPLHPLFLAYLRSLRTTHCLASFHGELRRGDGMAVFLDLEKAFELASPDAVLAALAPYGAERKVIS